MSTSISPEGKVIYDRVCHDVRKCFWPKTRIEFAPAETSQNGRLVRVSVFAHVYADELYYDHQGLLARICGIMESATETELEISGKVENVDLRLRIATVKQTALMAT